MPKNSPYYKFFKETLLWIYENGQWGFQYQRWDKKAPDCFSLVSSAQQFTWQQAISLFALIACAGLSSLLILLVELLGRNCSSQKSINQSKIELHSIIATLAMTERKIASFDGNLPKFSRTKIACKLKETIDMLNTHT